MKKKEYKETYANKVSKEKRDKKKADKIWIIIVTLMAFFISLAFSFLGETLVPNIPVLVGMLLIVFFILLGIIFDMVGIAVTVADEKAFNSMATKRVKGSSLAIKFIRNAGRVSSFCNDVIGDICGIISGGAGITIGLNIAVTLDLNVIIVNLLITSFIAAFTIGGKAIGKSYAINKSNLILFRFSRFIALFYNK